MDPEYCATPHAEGGNPVKRRRIAVAFDGARLIFRGVPPWRSLPAPIDDHGCDHCWRAPYATKREAHRVARSLSGVRLRDITVWQCGQYWHHGSRKDPARVRCFLQTQRTPDGTDQAR